jgi:hypothetical protein
MPSRVRKIDPNLGLHELAHSFQLGFAKHQGRGNFVESRQAGGEYEQ